MIPQSQQSLQDNVHQQREHYGANHHEKSFTMSTKLDIILSSLLARQPVLCDSVPGNTVCT